MKLIHIQIHIFYTNIQTAHKRQSQKEWKYHLETKTQYFFSCFSPSPQPVEVQFILQFIYTYIVSMHKRIPHPTPNDRCDLVGCLFNMWITLTHIETIIRHKISQNEMQNRNLCVLYVSLLTLLNRFLTYNLLCLLICSLCCLLPLSVSLKHKKDNVQTYKQYFKRSQTIRQLILHTLL